MKKRSQPRRPIQFTAQRFYIIVGVLVIVFLALLGRMLFLTVFDQSFLKQQGNVRMLRTVNVPAYRGMIMDRENQPLALSVPVDAIWVNPKDFPGTWMNMYKLGQIIDMPLKTIQQILHKNKNRYFVYLKHDVPQAQAKQVDALALPGLYTEREYQRHYPAGSVDAQIVGYTNIDDQGQAGLELAYNQWLQGVPGKKQVLKDRLGRIVAVVDNVKAAKPGQDLVLSINQRIQYLAYRSLKETVEKYHAETGSVVVLDPRTGEILGMVNYPSFDPNKPYSPPYNRYRNRAVTDMYEPGSTMKAFSIANALEIGGYTPDSQIDTNPGWIKINGNTVRDDGLDYGVITVRQVLQKSSNVGVAKMTINLPPEHLIDLLRRVGFGQRTTSGFPGEASGILRDRADWRPFELATLAFGYGISITPLQLAQAYGVIADQGKRCPVTFLKRDQTIDCPQAMKANVADEMLQMLTAVVRPNGTGSLAIVPGYNVAGKTGTAYIANAHGYNKKKHMSSFVGIAPVSDPRLVVAVVIRDPRGEHFGGLVAAPVFSRVMGGALRILDVPPDDLKSS